MISMQERPPYVRFEMRQVEDRAATLAEGRYIARDVPFALVTPAGSKDVFEAPAESWIAQCLDEARKNRYSPEWAAAFQAHFKAWKEGEELPESGTPIKTWALLSPAKREMYIRMHVRTVEDLAALTEEGLRNAGMGARADKMTAENWLQQSKVGADAGRITALQLENETLKTQMSEMQATMRAMAEQLRVMQEAPRRGRPRKTDDDPLEIETS